MKKAILLAAALSLLASTSFAGGGIDLSRVACPGNPGAVGINGGLVDCSGDTPTLTVIGTWAPAEDIPDFIALDGVLDLQVSGDLDVNGFWNFDPAGCNRDNLTSNHALPATGCSAPVAYTDTWDVELSGSSILASRRAPSYERMGISCYRTAVLPITAGQRMFGMQIVMTGMPHFDPQTGEYTTCPGCSAPFCLRWTEASPRSVGEVLPTDLYDSTGNEPGFTNYLSFNGASGGLCDFAVPTRKHTWGQLKSLYR